MGCCGKKEEDNGPPKVGDEFIMQNRGCTDCLCLLLFLAFWLGMIVVGSVGFSNGDPDKLFYGTQWDGKVCGIGDLKDKPNLWIASYEASQPIGFCYGPTTANGNAECPTRWGTSASDWYNQADLCTFCTGTLDCTSSTDKSTALSRALTFSGCYPVFYSSKPIFKRCVPTDSATSNVTSSASTDNIASSLTSGKYVRDGYGELVSAWEVVLICAIVAIILCFLWTMLIAFILKPIVYITLLVVLALLAGGGGYCYTTFKDLEDTFGDNPTSEETSQINTYKAFAYILFALAAIYLVLLVFMLKRIKIAIAIIQESSKALRAMKTLVFGPPFLMVVLVIVVSIWYIAVAAYLQSAEGSTETLSIAGTNNTLTKTLDDQTLQYMQLYHLFGYLWSVAFINAFVYCSIAMAVVRWYFSSTDCAEKKVKNPVRGSMKIVARYHLGSLAFGSLLLAIIRFIRILFNRMEKQMSKAKDNKIMKFFIYCIKYCLWYLEKLIKFINKNAYIYMCITGKNFCMSAKNALQLLVKNALRGLAVTFLGDFVLFLVKVLVVISTGIIGRALLSYNEDGQIAEGVETGIVPLFVIVLIAYVFASLFTNVFETCIDTVLLCFCYDTEHNDGGSKPYYMPESLDKLVNTEKDKREKRQKEKQEEMNKK